MTTPKIPVGIDDFKKLRTNNLYYVDKTHMIREFWDDGSDVILLPRPRRFGKSLNLSMLRAFFEQTEEDTRQLFDGLLVAEDEKLMSEQGQYPILYLNFKNIKFDAWKDAFEGFQHLLWKTCQRLSAQYPSDLWEPFRHLDQSDYPRSRIQESMLNACEVLHQITGKSAIVLIDEYDVPLIEAWLEGYYEEMAKFTKGLLGSLLKTNPFLKKAMLTGNLRLAKESIFTDLNNLEVYSLLHPEFSTCFGFTENEVLQILDDCAVDPARHQQIRDWYNGYHFGGQVIYNPWSVLKYVKHQPPIPEPYWANTSANELVRKLILEDNSKPVQRDLETLINGGALSRIPLDPHIVLRDLSGERDDVWNFLTFSGYLKPTATYWNEDQLHQEYDLEIPNLEVRSIYLHSVKSWLKHQLPASELVGLFETLRQKDWPQFHQRLQSIIWDSLSYHDTAEPASEKVYHAFVLGMLLHLRDYRVRSNRESGMGRYDVMLTPKAPEKPGFLFEFKKINSQQKESPEEAMQEALGQIQKMKYAAELQTQGVQEIIGIGVVVRGKEVWLETVSL